jgi:hypothetical protein
MLPRRDHLIVTFAPLVALLAALLVTPPVRADSGLLNDSLGRWLDTEVLPQLGRTLGEHPRFKGETIKVVSLANGQPTHQISRLHQAVEAHITQHLLRRSGVRIAWSDQPPKACGIDQPAVYLLGIEIERDGSYYHKLNIGMIDVAESVWVSGVNHTWRGRLTATEKAALAQRAETLPAGTVDNPWPVEASTEIAQSMRRHLKCAHPEGLNGPVYLQPGGSVELNRIIASLASELVTAPIAAITRDDDEAEWVLSLDESNTAIGGRVRELGLELHDKDRDVTQLVATVYVTGDQTTIRRPGDAIAHAAGKTSAVTGLLSSMHLEQSPAEGICDSRPTAAYGCAEVSFELLQPAYLFVLSSRDRQLKATSCEARLVEASTGERRFRIKIYSDRTELPDAGLYAIAVSDRSAAMEVARHIRTGVCSRPLNRSPSWLAELDALISKHANVTEWRAIHLSHTRDGITRI